MSPSWTLFPDSMNRLGFGRRIATCSLACIDRRHRSHNTLRFSRSFTKRPGICYPEDLCTIIFLHRKPVAVRGYKIVHKSTVCHYMLGTWNTWFDAPRTNPSPTNFSNLGRSLPTLAFPGEATCLLKSIILAYANTGCASITSILIYCCYPKSRTPTVLAYPNSLLLQRVHPRYLLSDTAINIKP